MGYVLCGCGRIYSWIYLNSVGGICKECRKEMRNA